MGELDRFWWAKELSADERRFYQLALQPPRKGHARGAIRQEFQHACAGCVFEIHENLFGRKCYVCSTSRSIHLCYTTDKTSSEHVQCSATIVAGRSERLVCAVTGEAVDAAFIQDHATRADEDETIGSGMGTSRVDSRVDAKDLSDAARRVIQDKKDAIKQARATLPKRPTEKRVPVPSVSHVLTGHLVPSVTRLARDVLQGLYQSETRAAHVNDRGNLKLDPKRAWPGYTDEHVRMLFENSMQILLTTNDDYRLTVEFMVAVLYLTLIHGDMRVATFFRHGIDEHLQQYRIEQSRLPKFGIRAVTLANQIQEICARVAKVEEMKRQQARKQKTSSSSASKPSPPPPKRQRRSESPKALTAVPSSSVAPVTTLIIRRKYVGLSTLAAKP